MPTVPEQFASLVDDAAIFPPGNAPLPDAVAAHRALRTEPWSDLVGPFVVKDVVLPELIEIVAAGDDAGPLPVAVVVTGGAGALEPAARWAGRAEQLRVVALEIALRDEEDLARNARRVTTMVDQLRSVGDLDDAAQVYVEPPRPEGPGPTPSWLGALDEVAMAGLRLKFRTGGLDADMFPTANALATCIDASLDRELAFKCTAGMHNAVRHRDEATGFEHHGFLNVLLTTRAALDGRSHEELVSLLDEQDADAVRGFVLDAGEDGLRRARRWFTSVGSCSVREAYDDLAGLGLLDAPGTGS